jgi:hypothetical protein
MVAKSIAMTTYSTRLFHFARKVPNVDPLLSSYTHGWSIEMRIFKTPKFVTKYHSFTKLLTHRRSTGTRIPTVNGGSAHLPTAPITRLQLATPTRGDCMQHAFAPSIAGNVWWRLWSRHREMAEDCKLWQWEWVTQESSTIGLQL